jgi:hypothetical protein
VDVKSCDLDLTVYVKRNTIESEVAELAEVIAANRQVNTKIVIERDRRTMERRCYKDRRA